ncbi:DNA-binding NarL/FixJ family response regulator [Bradyrhizobium elkanii]|nr:DNA-binding NarL/FixJ family response regulator [Bradyrhizobium elkanii]
MLIAEDQTLIREGIATLLAPSRTTISRSFPARPMASRPSNSRGAIGRMSS